MPILDMRNKEQRKKYDDFVKKAKYTSITQQISWSIVKENWEAVYVYLEEDDKIMAAMSILIIQNMGEYAFAYATKGPVVNTIDIELVNHLIKEAEMVLFQKNVFVLRMDPEFPFSEQLNDLLGQQGYLLRNRQVDGTSTIQPRFNMLVDLRGKNEEEVLADRYSKTRYRIRYAQRKGLEVNLSNDREDLKIFYQLYQTTSQRHGITYRPYTYFERLATAFLDVDQMKIIIVSIDGQPDAAGLCLISGNKVWYMYAGSTHQNQVLMAPYLVNWEGIKWAIQNNCDYYDLGGVFNLDNNDGLYQFKNGFIRPNTPSEYIGEIDKVYNQAVYQVFTGKNQKEKLKVPISSIEK